MANHGTTFEDLTQFGEILAIFARALAKALGNFKIKELLPVLQRSGKKLAELLETMFKQLLETIIYPVTVNYGRSVEDGVKAGHYNWSNSDINSRNFPTKRMGTEDLAVELIHFDHFDRAIPTDEALRELGKAGYRPAELHELLAFGEKYPDVQRQFPIVALGSVWQGPDGRRLAAVLLGDGSGRSLRLFWCDGEWGAGCRFATVRK